MMLVKAMAQQSLSTKLKRQSFLFFHSLTHAQVVQIVSLLCTDVMFDWVRWIQANKNIMKNIRLHNWTVGKRYSMQARDSYFKIMAIHNNNSNNAMHWNEEKKQHTSHWSLCIDSFDMLDCKSFACKSFYASKQQYHKLWTGLQVPSTWTRKKKILLSLSVGNRWKFNLSLKLRNGQRFYRWKLIPNYKSHSEMKSITLKQHILKILLQSFYPILYVLKSYLINFIFIAFCG